jgi:hypothetical protein
VLNDAGQVAFRSTLTGSGVDSSNNEGIWRGAPGSLSLVARRGSAAPGTASGVNYSSLGNPVLNDAGQVAFGAFLTGSGVDSSNNEGIWRGAPGSLSLVARRGSQAPGTAAGVNYSSLGIPVLNDAGQMAFWAFLTGSGVDSSNNQGIWQGAPGSLSLVARRGSHAPGTASGVNYSSLGHPVLNDAGQVAFWGFLTGSGVDSSNNEGIWRGAPGSLSLVARSGSQAAGTASGVNYSSLGIPVLNDAGQVAFWSFLTGSGVDVTNNQGIWIGDGSESLLVARRGELLAGRTISNMTLLGGSGGSDGRPRGLNDYAQLTYHAGFTDGSEGVFLFTPDVRWRRTFSSNWDFAGNWTLSIPPGAPHKVFIDPAVSLTVTGPTGAATVDQLQVGGGNGIATLRLNGGMLSVTGAPVNITPTGVLTGDGVIDGSVTNFGTVLADNVTITGTLTNHNRIAGSGRINAPVHNQGQIEAFGTEIEFTQLVTNTGTGSVFARNAMLRFTGGLANSGTVGLSFGTSDIFGNVTNNAGGQIIVSGNSNVTFYNAIAHNAGAEIRVSAGSTAVFFGPVTGSGAFAGGGTKFFEGGISSLATIETSGASIVEASASLTADVIREGALAVAGQVNLRPGGGASRVGSLDIDGGRLDIGNNQILIQTGNIAQTRAWLLTGRPGGSGIGSALAASEPKRDVGFGPTADGVMVKYTWAGDASLDGAVTIADLGILAANWQQSNRHWFQGDFNYDGSVNIADLGILAGNWQAGASGASSMSFEEALAMFDVFDGVEVPEPSCLAVLAVGGLLLRRRLGNCPSHGEM